MPATIEKPATGQPDPQGPAPAPTSNTAVAVAGSPANILAASISGFDCIHVNLGMTDVALVNIPADPGDFKIGAILCVERDGTASFDVAVQGTLFGNGGFGNVVAAGTRGCWCYKYLGSDNWLCLGHQLHIFVV
jgi:hypothetical protein